MSKNLYIAEKPSVAREFANALKENMKSQDGYLESEHSVVTWCVGHLVTMSYPEKYDEALRKWSLQTIPFIPAEYKYEVIDGVKKQFTIVSRLLNRPDVSTIYVCTDSGREGEYIYRLVEQMAQVQGKTRKRVWIDSQTEEEILRGIREAKDLSEYDALSDAAYLRAKEDYLMGINFSRALTMKYGYGIKSFLNMDKCVISVGRVMTCVLGMVVQREREIRDFVKTPFYRVLGEFQYQTVKLSGEWRSQERSAYYMSPLLYKENGFLKRETAEQLIDILTNKPENQSQAPIVDSIERKKETKNAPLLYNLAELQNDCSKLFKISPDETLRIVQELYEKKMVTYPRTDARVLSTAVSKEIYKNINGLKSNPMFQEFSKHILENGLHKGLEKTRYVNDKQITDHYAIIPTGQGSHMLNQLPQTSCKVYEIICRRFLSIFYPPAIYQKYSLVIGCQKECFYSSFKALVDSGYLVVATPSFKKDTQKQSEVTEEDTDIGSDVAFLEALKALKKGQPLEALGYTIKEGETTPPKRYNSGSIILTMENAGQFIEDEELRAQIKGNGIGTSATRAEILKKLFTIKYLSLNQKTQIITPTLMGELIYDVVNYSMKPMLNPALTASWEKGLTMVASGEITSEEYLKKLNDYVIRRTNVVKEDKNSQYMVQFYNKTASYYK